MATWPITWDHSARPERYLSRLTTMESIIDHNELDAALRSCGSTWNAGQAHGLLCSRLALTGADGASPWLKQVLADTDPDNAQRTECASMLEALWATTCRKLSARQSDFMLLLPDNDDPAPAKAEAMGQWCEGFLHGLVSETHGDELRARLASDPLSIVSDSSGMRISMVMSTPQKPQRSAASKKGLAKAAAPR